MDSPFPRILTNGLLQIGARHVANRTSLPASTHWTRDIVSQTQEKIDDVGRTGQAFTLIEIVVVIAIVAALTAVLMPAVHRVKEQRNMIECLANLRQWNPIISTYVESNDGKFFSGHGTESSWWISQLEDRHQSRMKNNLWFCPKSTRPVYDEHHNRANEFDTFMAWGIYTRDFNGHEDLSPDGIAGNYGLNGYVLSSTISTDHSPEDDIRNENHWQTPHVRGADNVPLLVEALYFDVRPQAHDRPADFEVAAWATDDMGSCCVNRHLGFESVSFCDSSARKVGLKELWTLKWHRQFDTSGPWTKAGGVQSSNWPDWISRFKDY